MILVDTSIWIDHLNRSEPRLSALLADQLVCTHPMIIGELALGTLRDRSAVLGLLKELPGTPVATHQEMLAFLEAHALYGIGLSLVDVHLLAGARLSQTARLWTRDPRLLAASEHLGLAV